MPGWYIHMESARQTALRLEVFPESVAGSLNEAERQELFEAAHRWRNYLAVGALGPDLFFLLPDFRGTTGMTILQMSDVALRYFRVVDETFVSVYERWVGGLADNADLIGANLTGGVSQQLAQTLADLSAALTTWIEGELVSLVDLFSLLGSGTQTGVDDNTFFWSDMFHYRKTYQFARHLLQSAKAEPDPELRPKLLAFSLGWISHCATDVAGHPFTNAKCGGPYRLHWQRHHLIENHMDSYAYNVRGGWVPGPPGERSYASLDTSALHMWIAFRAQSRAGYSYEDAETADGPCNDYFPAPYEDELGKPPSYGEDSTLESRRRRKAIFDVDTNPLPVPLCRFLLTAMQAVYPEGIAEKAPQILRAAEPLLRDENSGRPSVHALQNTFEFVFELLKANSSAGNTPPRPVPPGLLPDPSLPSLPFADDARNPGAGGATHSPDVVDLLLMLLLWPIYLAEIAIWAVSELVGAILGGLTLPLREAIYDTLEVPAYSAYLAARRMLTDTGYVYPMPEEIRLGLVQLGVGTVMDAGRLVTLLGAPDPGAVRLPPEASGVRPGPDPQPGDAAYPRAEVRDHLAPGGFPQPPWSGFARRPSAFRRPWEYPNITVGGRLNGFEAPLTHVGPFRQGERPDALVPPEPLGHVDVGSALARRAFEQAHTPAGTAEACVEHLPAGRTFGNPVDYGVYLLGRMWVNDDEYARDPLPDFNLDADRGYGEQCWDYVRRRGTRAQDDEWVNVPVPQQELTAALYAYDEPVTPPIGRDLGDSVAVPSAHDVHAPLRHRSGHDPMHVLWTAYRGSADERGASSILEDPDLDVSHDTMRRAGMSPSGRLL